MFFSPFVSVCILTFGAFGPFLERLVRHKKLFIYVLKDKISKGAERILSEFVQNNNG